MESDLDIRIESLEQKINLLRNSKEPDASLFSEICSQISIIETLLKYYNIKSNSRFNSLKAQHYKYLNDFTVYRPTSQRDKIERVNQEVDKVLMINEHIQEFVLNQGELINDISAYMDASEYSVTQTNNELKKFQEDLKKRRKFYRIVLLTCIIALTIIFLKIYRFIFL